MTAWIPRSRSASISTTYSGVPMPCPRARDRHTPRIRRRNDRRRDCPSRAMRTRNPRPFPRRPPPAKVACGLHVGDPLREHRRGDGLELERHRGHRDVLVVDRGDRVGVAGFGEADVHAAILPKSAPWRRSSLEDHRRSGSEDHQMIGGLCSFNAPRRVSSNCTCATGMHPSAGREADSPAAVRSTPSPRPKRSPHHESCR